MNEETIAGIVGWGKTLGCIASSITVNLPAPGHIHRGAGKGGAAHTVFRTGEVHGRITERAQEICRLVGYADSVTPDLAAPPTFRSSSGLSGKQDKRTWLVFYLASLVLFR